MREPFRYPDTPHSRRHGPRGYADYESYRPWLRDEFAFRCVYCLVREAWCKGECGFHIDHLVPQAESPSRALDYDNLVYACATCNATKAGVAGLPDPCATAYGDCLVVHEDGTVAARNREGELLIRMLRLDNAENTRFRRTLIEVIQLARDKKPALYLELMGFPSDLPDLAPKRPPGGNSRPEGIKRCFRARRETNDLPETY
jgi:hypothetical protein